MPIPDADLAECLTAEEWLKTSEQARVTGAVIELEITELGLTQQAGYPINMTETPPRTRGARRRVADVSEVLRRWDVPKWRISAGAERVHDGATARDAVGARALVDAERSGVANAGAAQRSDGGGDAESEGLASADAEELDGADGHARADAVPLQGAAAEDAQHAGGAGGAESPRPESADADEMDGGDSRDVVDPRRAEGAWEEAAQLAQGAGAAEPQRPGECKRGGHRRRTWTH